MTVLYPKILRKHVKFAIAEIDNDGTPSRRKSRTYYLQYEGKEYAPKYIVCIAYKHAGGEEAELSFNPTYAKSLLEKLGFNVKVIVEKENFYPEEISENMKMIEGAKKQVFVNSYERNQKARNECIKHYGAKCFVCGFDFKEKYGAIGEGFIHVHHLKEISKIGKNYEVNPVKDLRPVCPNCHAMLHKGSPAYTVRQLQKIMKN